MRLYKHFKQQKYLNYWLEGYFTFTKLTVFLEKEREENHYIDHQEASIIAEITNNETLTLEKFGNLDLFSFTDREIYKQIPRKEAEFILISSFSTETNEELRGKFGEYVLEFDFNKNLQALFSRKKIFFRDVLYGNDCVLSATDIIKHSYKDLGLKRKVIFQKRKQYSYQKEFRFVFFVNRDLVEKSFSEFFQVPFEEMSYFQTKVQDDKIKSLKPFFKNFKYR